MQQINVDEIIQKIRQEVKKRKRSVGEPARVGQPERTDLSFPNLTLPRFSRDSSFQFKEGYELNDYLQYHDEEFIRNAYRGILKREPGKK